jgi:uncharacterized metal-binding protein
MPDGATHRAATIKMTPLVIMSAALIPVITSYLFNDHLEYIIATTLSFVGYLVGYLFISAFIDPDADQISITSSEGRLMRKFGVFGFAVVWWFMPYGYFFKHRGVAHWHIIGTITRVVWAFWVPVTWYLLSGYTFPYMPFVYLFLASMFVGLALADSLHILMDNHV